MLSKLTQVKGYSDLDEEQLQVLSLVYARHMDTLQNPPEYAVDNIIEINDNSKQNFVSITFKNGKIFHYTPDGSWY
jgi:major membrane immunogen (membrane-anchored lipoprotein)